MLPWGRVAEILEAGAYACASDLFRYAMLARGLGIWVDTDCYCIRPIADAPSIYGKESSGLNTAVLKLAPDSPLLAELLSIDHGFVPPWLPWWRRADRRLRGWLGRPKKLQNMKWGTAGPRAMQYYARKHDVENMASARAVFYPVDWSDVRALWDPALRLQDLIQPQTLVVHLYNEMHRKLHLGSPPPSSPMGRILQEGAALLARPTHQDTAKPAE